MSFLLQKMWIEKTESLQSFLLFVLSIVIVQSTRGHTDFHTGSKCLTKIYEIISLFEVYDGLIVK